LMIGFRRGREFLASRAASKRFAVGLFGVMYRPHRPLGRRLNHYPVSSKNLREFPNCWARGLGFQRGRLGTGRNRKKSTKRPRVCQNSPRRRHRIFSRSPARWNEQSSLVMPPLNSNFEFWAFAEEGRRGFNSRAKGSKLERELCSVKFQAIIQRCFFSRVGRLW
jgi:hypothetical protein